MGVGGGCGFVFEAEEGMGDLVRSGWLGDVYYRQLRVQRHWPINRPMFAGQIKQGIPNVPARPCNH